MATKEFKLPDVGEGVAEGELVQWLVEPGDEVREDQPVAEVETDKAMVEVPSPYDGTVKELRAEEGEMVPVGDVIITFEVEEEGEADDGAESAAAETDVAESSETESGGGAADEGPRELSADTTSAVARRGEDDGEAAGEAEADATDAGTTEAEASPASADGRVFAPPSARRLARELGVDLAAVSGGGPGGRVTEADVRAAAESGGEESEAVGSADESEAAGGGEAAAEPRETVDDDVSAAFERGAEADADAAGESAAGSASGVEPAGRARTLAAPATRRVAEEEGVNIDDVPATETRDGQAFVTAEAVREYAAARRAGADAGASTTVDDEPAEGVSTAAVSAEAGATAEPEPELEPEQSPAPRGEPESEGEAAAAADASEGEGEGPTPGDRVPYRGIRRTIGQQMERSKYTAPHVSHHDDVDATDLVELRAEYKELAADRGVKLTYMPFVMKAVALALKEHPYVNSTLDEEEEEIVLKEEYNVGVATDTDAGLMVPVVRDVDQKSVLQIARETNELTAKARDRRISTSEMRGGSFTITNYGGIGGRYATPIINYPETAILGLGSIEKRPRVVDDEVVPRHTLPISMSVDHRVIDGAVAARFSNELKTYLENPKLLLLE